MRDESGKIHMWIGSDTEIHDQKRTEEELRRANQDLEQFAYSVSHDLQEPLRGIKIFSELLIPYGDNLDGLALEFLSNVIQSASRLEALLRDLLAYTQAGRLNDGAGAEGNAGDALQAALSNLNGAIVDSGACISSDPLPSVSVAAPHLQQIFQNLRWSPTPSSTVPGIASVVRISARRVKGDWLSPSAITESASNRNIRRRSLASLSDCIQAMNTPGPVWDLPSVNGSWNVITAEFGSSLR